MSATLLRFGSWRDHTDSYSLFKDQLVSKKATFSYLFIKISQSVWNPWWLRGECN